MPNPVIISDLEERFRPLTTAEQTVAQALLDDAWAIVSTTVPGLDSRMISGQLSEALVRAVVAAMTIRVLRNPDGIRQFAVDDYSQTRDQVVSSGLLYATPEEIAQLSPAPSLGLPGMFVVGLGG